ncbi:VCBS repeat-containing protein [Aquisalibacillus elongatus]|uniref:VCBS repeat-containing protein n=1 Tax=Aquisalibacillus elongatus TaxID=485577 RepID=UPI001FE3FE15|nr:VCBS repeat-containing protein [Aquisalibacillus elongatus]
MAEDVGDVTGDGVVDNIFLTGNQTPDSPFIQHITLVVRSGANDRVTTIPLSQNMGYNPTLFLGDFTGNGVVDILVSIDSGGSGATTYQYIYSLLNDRVHQLFNFEIYNNFYTYQVTYQDDYKVRVISDRNQKKYILDISTRGTEYLNEIYDQNGRLKEPIEGWVNPISGFYPVDFDRDSVYEILVYQSIAGRYNADSLGYVMNTLAWDGQTFNLDRQSIGIFGSDI